MKLAQGSKLKPLKPQKSKASSNNKQEMAKPNELKLTREKENIKVQRPVHTTISNQFHWVETVD